MIDYKEYYKKQDVEIFRAVRSLQADDCSDTNRLYELTEKYIYKLIYDIVKDPDTTDDLLSQAYVRIYNSLNTLSFPERFYSWAGRIATGLTLDHVKTINNWNFYQREDYIPGFSFSDASEDREEFIPESILADAEKIKILEEKLDTLTPLQRICVQFFYYEEMSVSDIAEVFDCSEALIREYLQRARSVLKYSIISMDVPKGVRMYSLAGVPLFLVLFRAGVERLMLAGAGGAATAAGVGGAAVSSSGGTAAASSVSGGAVASSAASETAVSGVSASSVASATASSASSSASAAASAGAVTASTSSTTVAASSGIFAGVKVVAVMLTVGTIGGAGYIAHDNYVREQMRIAEEARIEQERQHQLVVANTKQQYLEVFEIYEKLTGKTGAASDEAIAEHILSLSSSDIEVYKLLNDMCASYDEIKDGYRSCMTASQYALCESLMFDSFDAIMGTQLLSAEMTIDMNHYYGNRNAMKIYMTKTKDLIDQMTAITESGARVLNDPHSRAIMATYSTEEVESLLTQGITPPDMIAMYIMNNPNEDYGDLINILTTHAAISEKYMNTYMDYLTYITEDREYLWLVSDYQENHPEIVDEYYSQLAEALGQ